MELGVVVSYVPLLRASDPFITDPDKLQKLTALTDEENNGEAKGCIWTVEGNHAVATLIMPKAKEIHDHLVAWADDVPEKWFTLMYAKKNGMYSVALFPDVKKSIDRTRINYQLMNGGWPIQTAEKISIFFRPIMFVSKSTAGFDAASPWLGKKIKVYVVDADLVTKENFSIEKLESRLLLGNFSIMTQGPQMGYLDDMMKLDE